MLFPVKSLLMNPDYTPHMNPAKWGQEIISQPVIMFSFYGQWGRHVNRLAHGFEEIIRSTMPF
jgi:hypothetical protein